MLEFMPTRELVVNYSNAQGLCLCRVKVHLEGAVRRDVVPPLLPAQPSLKSLDRSARAFVQFDLAMSRSADTAPLADESRIAEQAGLNG
jgi:hypothetical protein